MLKTQSFPREKIHSLVTHLITSSCFPVIGWIMSFILLLGNKGYIYFYNCKEPPVMSTESLNSLAEQYWTATCNPMYGGLERDYVGKRGQFTQIFHQVSQRVRRLWVSAEG